MFVNKLFMFITPYFGGCKYANNFLFINKNIEFQCFGVLITLPDGRITTDTPSHLVATAVASFARFAAQ
jgi:hypothetical protein